MSFEAFDTRKIDEYAAQAKASWGKTAAYKEFEQKAAGRTKEEDQKLGIEMMAVSYTHLVGAGECAGGI